MNSIPKKALDQAHFKTNDLRKRMDVLKSSHESGIVNDEEFEKQKESLETEIKEFDKAVEEANKEEIKKEGSQEPQANEKKSDKALIIGIAVIVILLIAVFSVSYFYRQQPKTIEDMHILNLQGKLKPEEGYVYKGLYSFVALDNLWYTQLKSPKGTRLYDLALRYSPKDVEDIDIKGKLDDEFFNNQTEFYYTFNPKGKDFAYVALAAADFSTHMAKAFEKTPVSACDRNETSPCWTTPIVTCDDKDKIVLYINESGSAGAMYSGNCIIINGKEFELVKGVDRVLYNLYGIMEQQE